MPRLTRVWIKTALGYLIVAMALKTGLAWGAVGSAFAPAFIHLLTVGWLTQLIFGVAWWLFPPRSPENPRGNERRAWAVYALLNAGLLLRVAAEPWPRLGDMGEILLIASALLQTGGIAVFTGQLWPRARGFGSRGT